MRNKKFKKTFIIVGTVGALSVSAFAATFLNWTGAQTVTATNIFINKATNKIIAQEELINSLKAKRDELQSQLDDLKNNGSAGTDTGIQNEIIKLNQQIVELNNTIIEKENVIIEKNNEIAHLTQQLTTANEQVAGQQVNLDQAMDRLRSANINLDWTEAP